jgi:hypothetical protein
MKKFLIVIVVMFITNLGCKKITDSGGLCACSPISAVYLSLVIKNTAAEDLLSNKTVGAFTSNQIQLYYKESNGAIKQISFTVRQPFSYGTDQFKYFQLFSQEIAALPNGAGTIVYLKLGDNAPYELKLQYNTYKNKVEKLLINDKEAPIETGKVSGYLDGNIFYLTL